jgi:hypothetical protein
VSLADEGPHVIRVRARQAGVTVAVGQVTVVVDRTAPTLEVDSGLDPAWSAQTTRTLRFTAADDNDAVSTQVQVDGHVVDEAAGDGVELSLSDGVHGIRMRSLDSAGNASGVVAGQLRVDSKAPVAAIDAPAAAVPGSVVSVSDRSTDATSAISSRRWERGGRDAGNDPTLTFTMPDEAVDLKLTATDEAGNAGTRTAQIAVAPATPPPGATAPPPATVASSGATTIRPMAPVKAALTVTGKVTRRALLTGRARLTIRTTLASRVTIRLLVGRTRVVIPLVTVRRTTRAGVATRVLLPRIKRSRLSGRRAGLRIVAVPIAGGAPIKLSRKVT